MKTHQSFSKIASIVIAQYKGNDPSFKNRASFWIDHLGDLPFDQITPDDIEEGLAKYIARGKLKVIRVGHGPGAVEFESTGKPLSPATINRMRIAVSSIVKFAKEKYLLPNTYISPVKGTRRQKESNGRYVEITRVEIEELVNAARLAKWKKLSAFIAVGATSGLRAGNIQKLTWSNINFDKGMISVPTSKNGTPYSCGIPSFAIRELKLIQTERDHPEDLVFGSLDYRSGFLNAVARAGLKEKLTCFHLMRHVSASLLAQNGFGEMTIMKQLNQKTSAMASRYTHLSNEYLTEAVSKAWG